jgi:hypothetical protein
MSVFQPNVPVPLKSAIWLIFKIGQVVQGDWLTPITQELGSIAGAFSTVWYIILTPHI